MPRNACREHRGGEKRLKPFFRRKGGKIGYLGVGVTHMGRGGQNRELAQRTQRDAAGSRAL